MPSQPPPAQSKEFFSYFYVYQLMMYMIWFWYSYVVTGALVFSVVILSGLVKCGVARWNQTSLKKLTDYITPVIALRDEEWTMVPSSELVSAIKPLGFSRWGTLR